MAGGCSIEREEMVVLMMVTRTPLERESVRVCFRVCVCVCVVCSVQV